MPLTYLDQNALLGLGFKAGKTEFRQNLRAAIESGALCVVVSSWHLIEIANTSNVQSATRLAEFMDSLNPAWLLERRNIHLLDFQEDFCRFLKIACEPQPRVTTRSAAFAALSGQPDAPRFDIPSRDFVRQWIAHPEQLKELVRSVENNADSLIRLREIVKAGKLTEEIKRRTFELMVKASVPKVTPAGLEVGRELRDEYVKQAMISASPTLAIETAISENEWSASAVGKADRNTLIDKFHIMSALPYVDEIVSDDAFFHEIYPVAAKSGRLRAQLRRNAEFLRRF